MDIRVDQSVGQRWLQAGKGLEQRDELPGEDFYRRMREFFVPHRQAKHDGAIFSGGPRNPAPEVKVVSASVKVLADRHGLVPVRDP